MNEQQIRDILRPHTGQYGSPLHRLHATGEITEHTIPALRDLNIRLMLDGRDCEADEIDDVIEYAIQVGARPAVTQWTGRAKEQRA